MRRARADANQPDIVAAFRRLGVAVAHTHMVGAGFPDVVVSLPGITRLVEIKDGSRIPSERRLTPDEKRFHEAWPDKIHVIESVDDVLAMVKDMRGLA